MSVYDDIVGKTLSVQSRVLSDNSYFHNVMDRRFYHINLMYHLGISPTYYSLFFMQCVLYFQVFTVADRVELIDDAFAMAT